jgi:DNA-binding MarR family transcriptional regulator
MDQTMNNETTTVTDANNDDTAAHTVAIGRSMGRWRVLVGRRVLARLAIDNVSPGLDITHIDVLDAVRRAEPKGEVTVGAVAEAMRIDPSRASRIVGDMVARGLLKRQASQSDARRILLVMTEPGQKLMAEIQAVKRRVIDGILADWSPEDIAQFDRLFDRFVTGFEQLHPPREKE